jgi:hypothetical protein
MLFLKRPNSAVYERISLSSSEVLFLAGDSKNNTAVLEYKPTKFILGIDTEKVLEAGFTGLNTRAGDLLTVKFKYAQPSAGGVVNPVRVADLMHIVLHSDHILEIHDTGVRVFA